MTTFHHASGHHHRGNAFVGFDAEIHHAVTEIIPPQLPRTQSVVHKPGAGVMHLVVEQRYQRRSLGRITDPKPVKALPDFNKQLLGADFAFCLEPLILLLLVVFK